MWLAADQLGRPYGALIKLLILTGQRRDEVARLLWDEVDFGAKLWTLPAGRTKNGRPHGVPLVQPVIEILEALPRIGDFVLTTKGRSPASNFAAHKSRLDALLPADMPPWRLHDLRRTAATGMARLSVNLPVVEKILNHSSGSFAGVAGIYNRHDFADEKRRALDLWSEHVVSLGQESGAQRHPSPVIRLQARA